MKEVEKLKAELESGFYHTESEDARRSIKQEDYADTCKRLGDVIRQEVCGDTISRKAVCDLLSKEWIKYVPMELDMSLAFVLGKIDELPSVIPAERTGHWEKNGKSFICSECGDFALKVETGCLVNRHLEPYLSSYCPNCGARMKEGEE